MSTASVAYYEAANEGAQDLFTIELDQFDKTIYASAGSSVDVAYNALGRNEGTDIVINEDGTFTCQPDVKYLATVEVQLNNITVDPANKPTISIVETDTGNVVSSVFNYDQTLTAVLTPGAEQTYVVKIASGTGKPFAYPAQVVNAHIVVQAISGWTI